MIVLKYVNKQSIKASKNIFLCMNSRSVQGQHFFCQALNDRLRFYEREQLYTNKHALVFVYI